jgi:hypothetical protein
MKLPSLAICALCLVLSLDQIAQAVIVAQYVGNDNPVDQGWTEHPHTGGDVGIGGIIDYDGTPSWIIDDKSMAPGSTYIYDQVVSDEHIAQGNTNGWQFHFDFRVLWSPVTNDGTLMAGYRDGQTAWQMNFAFDDDSNTVVKLFTDVSGPILGPMVTIPGNDYHTYSLIYNPASGSADFLVDGAALISNYIGFPTTEKRVLFGAGLASSQGNGKFHSVLLTTNDHPIPEPSSLVLALVGLVGLALARRLQLRRTA